MPQGNSCVGVNICMSRETSTVLRKVITWSKPSTCTFTTCRMSFLSRRDDALCSLSALLNYLTRDLNSFWFDSSRHSLSNCMFDYLLDRVVPRSAADVFLPVELRLRRTFHRYLARWCVVMTLHARQISAMNVLFFHQLQQCLFLEWITLLHSHSPPYHLSAAAAASNAAAALAFSQQSCQSSIKFWHKCSLWSRLAKHHWMAHACLAHFLCSGGASSFWACLRPLPV